MEIPIEIVALIGIILGVVGKTAIPYIRKVFEDPNLAFNWGYFFTMCTSGVVAAIFVYPTFVIPEGNPWMVFITALFFAAGVNGIINFVAKNKIQR